MLSVLHTYTHITLSHNYSLRISNIYCTYFSRPLKAFIFPQITDLGLRPPVYEPGMLNALNLPKQVNYALILLFHSMHVLFCCHQSIIEIVWFNCTSCLNWHSLKIYHYSIGYMSGVPTWLCMSTDWVIILG